MKEAEALLQSITQDVRTLGIINGTRGGAAALLDNPGKINSLPIGAEIKERLIRNFTWKERERFTWQLEKGGYGYVYRDEPHYPKRLLELPDPPMGLFFEGKLSEESRPSLAVVGPRQCSQYGFEMARYFTEELAGRGIEIISGLAHGIDRTAHEAALKKKGRTVAVLGSGIGVPYPKENWECYFKIRNLGGLLLSEYPPEAPPLAHHFPIRNRIISGLSDAVLVVEAREKSGTLITVDAALEQGREVFVIPGRISDKNSRGCNNLIKQGARLVTEPEEIYEELIRKFPFYEAEREASGTDENEEPDGLSEIEKGLASKQKMVYSLVRLDLKHVDVLINETGLNPAELLVILSELQELGLITEPFPNCFSRPYRG